MSFINYILGIPTRVVIYFFDTVSSVLTGIISPCSSRQVLLLKSALNRSTSLKSWKENAEKLDKGEKNDLWKMRDISGEYDYKLIRNRLTMIKSVSQAEGISSMMFLLRAGLIRNLGGIGKSSLYANSHIGTKELIESYVSETAEQIRRIAWTNEEEITDAMKIDYLSDVLQSFGRSALIFHGGASFGLCHLGVAKALFDANMLPKVVCGSYIGALVAALICSKSAQELEDSFFSGDIDISSFERHDPKSSFKRKIVRLLQHGRLFDIKVIEECAKDNIGDITFKEAFRKTGRILNIIVHAKRKHEVPVLLNYLTAPDVVIWSAASASCAVPGIYDSAILLTKDSKGQLIGWNPSAVRLSSARILDEIPVSRLSELFNVNNFIVSHVPSYFSFPVVKSKNRETFLTSLCNWIFTEFQHRLNQLKIMGLIPLSIQKLEQVFSAPDVGDIKISPTILTSDFQYIFSNPTPDFIRYCIFKGEQACWKNISQIEIRCAIEFELDRMIQLIKGKKGKLK